MIEYDKANVTSSYPSLTTYEVETILDKAYLALIAQKVTGNNPRKAGFESDIKSIHDIQGLIATETKDKQNPSVGQHVCDNEYIFIQPTDTLYYIESHIIKQSGLNDQPHDFENVELINHAYASKFRCTSSNLPWIETPVAYINNNKIHVLLDPIKLKNGVYNNISLNVTYIKEPAKFVHDPNSQNNVDPDFELSDTMAEELINLAIVFATENVESPRLQTKSSILTLES